MSNTRHQCKGYNCLSHPANPENRHPSFQLGSQGDQDHYFLRVYMRHLLVLFTNNRIRPMAISISVLHPFLLRRAVLVPIKYDRLMLVPHFKQKIGDGGMWIQCWFEEGADEFCAVCRVRLPLIKQHVCAEEKEPDRSGEEASPPRRWGLRASAVPSIPWVAAGCVMIISQVQQPHYAGTSGSAKTIPSRGKSRTSAAVTQLGSSSNMGCSCARGWPTATAWF